MQEKCIRGGYHWYAKLYEVTLDYRPVIKALDKTYPLLEENGVKSATNTVNIRYIGEPVENKYKIDDGEWNEYTGDFVVDVGHTVYAKCKYINGMEANSSFEVTDMADALESAVYDGNEDTYIQQDGEKFMQLAPELQNRQVKVKLESVCWNRRSYIIYKIL